MRTLVGKLIKKVNFISFGVLLSFPLPLLTNSH